MARPDTAAAIDDAAAEWVARADRAVLSAEETRQLEEWLNQDPRRVGAFARAKAVLARFDRAQALGEGFDPTQFAVESADRSRSVLQGRHRRWTVSALAASFVLAIAIVFYIQLAADTFVTRLGEMRAISLSDGSRVALNTASRMTVHYSATERRIELGEGEALFTVGKDPTRPFVVEARGTRVRALGTSFTVRSLEDEAVRVLVSEGVVEVTAGRKGVSASPVRVSANTTAVAAPRSAVKVAPVTSDEVSRELAWRDGMISFGGVTLREAAREFARYSEMRILLDDPAVAERTVAGLFAADNPVGFARAIATSMNLVVEVQSEGVHLKAPSSRLGL